MTPHRTLALVISVMLGAGGAALMAGSDDGGDVTLIAHSVDAVADAGSYRMAMTIEMAGAGESFTMTGDGIFREAPLAGEMTMGVDLVGESLDMKMILLNTTLYMNMGEAMGAAAPTPWVSIDLASVAGMGDVLGGAGPGNSNPRQFLEMLRGAGREQVVGREDVRGVSTTHYTARITLKDALDAAGGTDRASLEAVLDGLGEGAAGMEVPVDAWLDDQGLPRRIKIEMDLTGMDPSIPAGASMTVTMEMFDYGIAVDVQAPPADQVTDMTEMMGAASPD